MKSETAARRRYRIGELLGQGGMGAVFHAVDEQTREAVAIKRLQANAVLSTPEAVERFRREGEALRLLDHPNIVKVLDVFQDTEGHYLVMELVAGGSLAGLLNARGPLAIERVLALSIDLSDALARAHQLGIVHRDIKPENVLLAPDGTPRLGDFGVASIAGKERLSGTRAIVGTLDYLSPEAVAGTEVDARADIWAFGVLLFEMLAGRRPFDGGHPGATLNQILHAPPPDLEALRGDCPIGLVDLVYRMLEKDRDRRIASVRQVGAELERVGLTWQRELGTERPPPRPELPRPFEQPRANAFAVTTLEPLGAPAAAALPVHTTPLVGRERDLAELARLLADPAHRIVSLVGPGGMGKSRLAVEAARQLGAQVGPFAVTQGGAAIEQDVVFVELASLLRADLVLPAIAAAVGFSFYPGGDPKTQLFHYLRDLRVLLVLDNFEHVIEASSLVHELVQAVPGARVLATSRERLGLSAETVLNLSGLAFPELDAQTSLGEFSGVRLFLESARRTKLDFEMDAAGERAAARICALVQGMPLGILLAASWVNVLDVHEIAVEIGRSFEFVAAELRDLPARQHSLRAVFAYSFERLDSEERRVFSGLGVFRGGFTRAAAEEVLGASLRTLATLVNQSLVTRDPASGRYRIHELLRQYAQSLADGSPSDAERTADRHAAYYVAFLDELRPRFTTVQPELAADEIDQELGNVRATWTHLLETRNVPLARKALETLDRYYSLRCSFDEGELAFRAAAAHFREPVPEVGSQRARLLARALTVQARFAGDLWRHREAVALTAEARALIGEECCFELGDALLVWGSSTTWLGDSHRGSEATRLGLEYFRRADDPWETARALLFVAQLSACVAEPRAAFTGRDEAEAQVRESIELQRFLAAGEVVLPVGLDLLGVILIDRGEYEEGCTLLEQALALSEKQGRLYTVHDCLAHLASAERKRGDYVLAERYARRGLALARARFPFAEAWTQLALAEVLKEDGRVDEAHAYFRASVRDSTSEYHALPTAIAMLNLAEIEFQHDQAGAEAMLHRALAAFEQHRTNWGIVLAKDYLAQLSCSSGRRTEAGTLFAAALASAVEHRWLPLALNVVAGIARAAVLDGELERAVELLTLVARHPARERQTMDRRVAPLLRELESRLSAAEYDSAVERGAALEPDATLRGLCA